MIVRGGAEQQVEEINLKADALQIPLHAMVELTYRCNIDCIHCYCQYLENTKNRSELSTDEWKRVLYELAGLGVLNLTLTGGEIFVRRDFWDIALHAKSCHFSLTLFTNGTMINEKRADLLEQLRPTSIEMTLLGATEESHDRLAKMKGAWKRTMRGADLLRERKLPFVFKSTLMKENIHEAHNLESVAKFKGCRTYRKGIEISPRNDGNCDPMKYQLDRQALFEFYIDGRGGEPELPEEQMTRELSRQKGTCGAGVNGCAINPYGDFLPCIQLMIPFGNIRQRSLQDMWSSPPETLALIRNTKHYGEISACSQCDAIDYCHRCHGLAHLETGSWDSCYRMAGENAEVVRAVVKYKKEGVLPLFEEDATTSCGYPGTLVQIQVLPA
jgi:radical SAM protein with 4Fe4S-binding SPASM domain